MYHASTKPHDAKQEVLCNLTRDDQQCEEVFLCFAYRPMSPGIVCEEVLRELCEEAGVEYPEELPGTDDEPGSISS